MMPSFRINRDGDIAASPPCIPSDKRNDDDDNFLDPRQSMSISSNGSDLDDDDRNRNGRSHPRHSDRSFRRRNQKTSSSSSSLSSSQTQIEYYDAADDFFSDGSISNSSPSFRTKFIKDLKTLKLSFIEESERRERADTDLLYMHTQWQRLAACLSQMGLTSPEMQSSNNLLQIDPAALCQEIVVTGSVSEAIERALARAETELITESIVDCKNQEISRLCDRVQYYGAVNREMSQRNQEAAGYTRQQRSRRTKWNLIWGCAGLWITFGASLLAYLYVPSLVEGTLPSSNADASLPPDLSACRGS